MLGFTFSGLKFSLEIVFLRAIVENLSLLSFLQFCCIVPFSFSYWRAEKVQSANRENERGLDLMTQFFMIYERKRSSGVHYRLLRSKKEGASEGAKKNKKCTRRHHGKRAVSIGEFSARAVFPVSPRNHSRGKNENIFFLFPQVSENDESSFVRLIYPTS